MLDLSIANSLLILKMRPFGFFFFPPLFIRLIFRFVDDRRAWFFCWLLIKHRHSELLYYLFQIVFRVFLFGKFQEFIKFVLFLELGFRVAIDCIKIDICSNPSSFIVEPLSILEKTFNYQEFHYEIYLLHMLNF